MSKIKKLVNKFGIFAAAKPGAILAAFLLLSITTEAFARAGGGQSYHSHSSGGSDFGGGGGEGIIVELLVRLLIRLIIECPEVGIPLTIALLIAIKFRKQIIKIVNRNKALDEFDIDSEPGQSTTTPLGDFSNQYQAGMHQVYNKHAPVSNHSHGLSVILQDDANFSEPLFFDFVQLLYVRILRGLHNKSDLQAVEPYVRQEVLNDIKDRLIPQNGYLTDVVIGGLRFDAARVADGQLQVLLTVKSEQTLINNGRQQRIFTENSLLFMKKSGVLSKGPENISAFGCPNCGATAGISAGGVCSYCGSAVQNGQYHWLLCSYNETNRNNINLQPGQEHVAQVLHQLVIDNSVRMELATLQASHPEFSQATFETRVKEAFKAIQKAYSEQRWEMARPYESDAIFDVHRFWIDYYKKSGRRNVIDNINIQKVLISKVTSDAFYEAITVYIRASMLDYTIDNTGRVLSGSDKNPTTMAEYWTFIRSRAAAVPTQQYVADQCPSCGAPIKINQNGKCEYCGTVVTSGNFDWVLSRIDQDGEYIG